MARTGTTGVIDVEGCISVTMRRHTDEINISFLFLAGSYGILHLHAQQEVFDVAFLFTNTEY